MKFNLTLDESLFDDDFELFEPEDKSHDNFSFDLDDDFSEYDEHSLDNVPSGPSEGSDTGVAAELIALINDEWEAIQGYNNAIATLRTVINNNPFYADAIRVLEEISAEENTHVGQLQEVLKQISPNAAEIQKGTQEARTQLGFVGGVLPVQSWDSTPDLSKPVACDDEMCTITDIDDDM